MFPRYGEERLKDRFIYFYDQMTAFILQPPNNHLKILNREILLWAHQLSPLSWRWA